MKNCNKKSAAGSDNINNLLLLNCPENILDFIFHLFNASLKLGYIPHSWKAAKIIMLHKKGKPPDDFTSYRPISLLNCISKLLEKLINNKLMYWAETNNILPACQSGFRKSKNCQDQILRLNQGIINGFKNKKKTCVVFFDLEKAFDKASHNGIIHKLTKLNLNTTLLNWISNYLIDRSFHVSWNNKSSKAYKILTGAQGSCLSPSLFILFFSDISEIIP